MSMCYRVRCRLLELFFFPFLFSGYCRCAGSRVISIVSGGCSQSCSVLFHVVFESLYRSVHAVFNAVFLPLFLTHIVCQRHLWDARPYIRSLVFLFSCPFVWGFLWSAWRMVPSILRRWWSFTGVWVTANLLNSPGLFSVFWPFSII